MWLAVTYLQFLKIIRGTNKISVTRTDVTSGDVLKAREVCQKRCKEASLMCTHQRQLHASCSIVRVLRHQQRPKLLICTAKQGGKLSPRPSATVLVHRPVCRADLASTRSLATGLTQVSSPIGEWKVFCLLRVLGQCPMLSAHPLRQLAQLIWRHQ